MSRVFVQEQLECSKRGWELQQLRKLKEEEEEQQFMDGDEDLFTYTREDAYNMVGGHCALCWSNKKCFGLCCFVVDAFFSPLQQEYVFDAEDGHTEIMPVGRQLQSYL